MSEFDEETERMEIALPILKEALSYLHHDDEGYCTIKLTIEELEDIIERRKDE